MKSALLLALAVLLPAPLLAASPGKKKSAREVVLTRLFNEANTDGNDYLDEAEFANSYGASPRLVVTEYRFATLSIPVVSTRGNEIVVRGVFLVDFIEANGGRKFNPTKEDIFLLADDNSDGFIDWLEYPVTRIQKSAVRGSIFDSFDKLDRNDDGLISPEEWGLLDPA
jgi:hypothetical protein